MDTTLVAGNPGDNGTYILEFAFLVPAFFADGPQLAGLLHIGGNVLITDRYRHQTQFFYGGSEASITMMHAMCHGHHLDDGWVGTVDAVLGASFALGHPDGVIIAAYGVANISR